VIQEYRVLTNQAEVNGYIPWPWRAMQPQAVIISAKSRLGWMLDNAAYPTCTCSKLAVLGACLSLTIGTHTANRPPSLSCHPNGQHQPRHATHSADPVPRPVLRLSCLHSGIPLG
jgi:hypothetical protein